MFQLNKELKLHIKRLQRRSIFSMIAIILIIISIFFLVPFLIDFSFVAIVFFTIIIVSSIYLIYMNHIVNKELKEIKFEPVIFKANRNFSFNEVVTIFEKLTNKENKFSLSDDLLFFRLNKIFKLRVILYKTVDFDKKDFNNVKECINKKVNKKLNISSRVNSSYARKMMRFNIIYTDTLNDALYQFISQNVFSNMTRVEGVINIVIIGNQIIIPPIYGDCDLIEINRYKNVIKFINQVLLSN